MATSLKQQILNLRRSLKYADQASESWISKYYEEENKRIAYEIWIKGKLDWWLELLEKSQTPCLKALIKNTATVLGMK